MVKEVYTKKEILQILSDILDHYDSIELYRYWWNSYLGSCRSKIDIERVDGGYKVIFHCDEC